MKARTNQTKTMTINFNTLQTGEKFAIEYRDNTGTKRMEYEKISHTSGRCINQIGYGNKRAINCIYYLYSKQVKPLNA